MSESWPVLPLTPDPPSVSMTAAAWLELAEDETGELVRGRLVEEEAPDAVHEVIVAWLIRLFGNWLDGHGLVLGSGLKILVGEQAGRKPDVVVYREGSVLPQRNRPVTALPDLVVEVVSPLLLALPQAVAPFPQG